MSAAPTHTHVAVADLVRLLDTLAETKDHAEALANALEALLAQFAYVKDLSMFNEAKTALENARKAGL